MSSQRATLTESPNHWCADLVGDGDLVGGLVVDRPRLGLERVADLRCLVDDRAGLAERVGPEQPREERG